MILAAVPVETWTPSLGILTLVILCAVAAGLRWLGWDDDSTDDE